MNGRNSFLKNYAFSLILIGSILFGALLGILFKERAVVFKPLGDIFLNLLFTVVVPLVFFSISSAVAGVAGQGRLKKIFLWMLTIFVVTGLFAAAIMIAAVQVYPPAAGFQSPLPAVPPAENLHAADQIVRALTVSDFAGLLSKQNMLALILFSILIGLSASAAQEKGRAFRDFLSAGNAVMIRCVSYILYYAPIGLGAYFAYIVGVWGGHLLNSYIRVMTLYYPVALLYFIIAFSAYAFWAGRWKGLKLFWGQILPTGITAWATGSSVATIPVNLEAARRIGTPQDIREVVIPVGATIHMEGSCLAAIVKIAFLFGVFGMDFSGVGTIAAAVGIAILSGTVMSGIPGGGFLGELLIVTMYGFPPEALPMISMIGTLVDPPATMVNAVGDNVSGMMIARILGGPDWLDREQGPSSGSS